jgi:hypothetical protein
MTPKEKARELVFMFSHEVRGIFFKKFRVKRCALIAVDELIKQESRWNNGSFYPSNFWEQVKQEINKL